MLSIKENKIFCFLILIAEKIFAQKATKLIGQDSENFLDDTFFQTVNNPRKEGILKLPSHELLISEFPSMLKTAIMVNYLY